VKHVVSVSIGSSARNHSARVTLLGEEILVERINRVIEEARRQKMLIVAMHTGGQPRRGDLADPFIHAAAPNADFLVVRNDGNKDGVFMKIAAKGNIPIVYIEQTMEVKNLLSEMFQ
jgi:nicotinamidase-related amidase